MIPEEMSKKENYNPVQPMKKPSKSESLKMTIQNIVKANNDFLRKQESKKEQTVNQLSTKPPIEINPRQIIFESVVSGLDYCTTFTVTNLTGKQKKIKIQQPKNSIFVFENSETALIAPGIQFKCGIFFKCRSVEEVHEVFCVISDDFSIEVPISVYPPKGLLSFDPLVKLGFVPVETPVPFKVKFVNMGSRQLTLEMITNDELMVSSHAFPLTLHENSCTFTKFEVNFTRTGVFQNRIMFSIQGSSHKHFLEISATAVAFSNFLVDEKGSEVSVLNFDEVVLGDERTKKVILINNSPKKCPFKIQILKGLNNEHFRDQAKPQTPFDLGMELSEQVIFCEPSSGIVDSYGYQVLLFRMKTKPTLDEKFFVAKFAISDPTFEETPIKSKRQFNYTAFVTFEDNSCQKSIQIFANGSLPLIHFSHHVIQFGEQLVGTKSSFELVLANDFNLPVPITGFKESFLQCVPAQFVLKAKETRNVTILFTPKNLGIFNGKYAFKLNSFFEIMIDVSASSVSPSVPKITKSGQHQSKPSNAIPSNMLESFCPFVPLLNVKSNEIFGRSNSNMPSPSDRINTFPKLEGRKYSMIKKSLKDGSADCDMKEPIPTICKQTPALFVLKPVKNNEPNNLRSLGAKFQPDVKQVFKEFPSFGKDYEESRQMTEKLSGEKLMRIQVGPTEIDFGRIFVNSSESLWFQVKNDLWTSIICNINTDKLSEFRETSQKPQVIPSGKTAGFKIVVNSPIPKIIREKINYVINGTHSFHFIVNAEIVPVDLEINKPIINFKFKDESVEMSTSETFTLKNTGNAPAFFRLRIENPNSPFKLITQEGIVKENSSKDIELTYHPMSSKDEDMVILDIERGGPPKTIRCFGVAHETTFEVSGVNINLGSLAVGQRKSSIFTVKNTHNKYYTIFKLDENTVPEGVEIRQKHGKICPEDILKIELEFMLRKRIEYKNHEIIFHVRGASPIKVNLSLATIVPNVDIEQQEFNFDKITFGNKAWRALDISNRSPIPAELFLNLSSSNAFLQEKYDCVDLEYINKNNSDSTVFEKIEKILDDDEKFRNSTEKQRIKNNSIQNSLEFGNINSPMKEHFESKKQDKNESQLTGRSFVFTLKPNRTYNFKLYFSPVKPSVYDFDLTFSIPGQEGNLGLKRKVYCLGTNPRFLMEPLSGIIEFPRKIILSPESVIADKKMLTISNPSFEEQLIWSLDTSSIDPLNTFFITPSSGMIDPQCTATIHVSFRPLKSQMYEGVIPLFIDNKPTPHSEIRLKGEGSFPKVVFSTEEVLLVATPLNVTSYGYISLSNDGYQNSSFTAYIPNEYVKLGLSIDFLNGNMLGINTQRIFLKISFLSPTPVSFTARVNIEDDLKRSFSFSISGVSDNSILSYSPFLSLGYFVNSMFRNHLDSFESIQNYDPEFKNCQSITIDPLTQAPKFGIKNDKKMNDFGTALMEMRDDSLSPKKTNSMEDSDQTAIDYYTQLSLTIRTWLSEYGIASIIDFPEDLINSNGQQFYELLEFLLKSPPTRPKLDPNLKNVDRVLAVVQNHYNLLNFLKENNAMVNTIRPHFLLSYKDLVLYSKSNQQIHISPDYYKINDVQFKLLSLQSWTVLYLQAIKVFFVSRITIKDFKQSLFQLIEKKQKTNLNDENGNENADVNKDIIGKRGSKSDNLKDKRIGDKNIDNAVLIKEETEGNFGSVFNKILPEYPYEKNSLSNTSEALLLRWLEVLIELKTQESIRLKTFGKDLQNCYYFCCAVDVYTGHETQLINRVKQITFIKDDLVANLDTFKNTLHDFGIKEEICEADFLNASPVGMLLTTAHFFKTLPPYLPKSTIEFNCALHEKMIKEITLSNPTTKSIMYSVRLFGQKNFTVENDLIKLEGKQTIMVPVSFYANTSSPVEGKIFFQNRKNGKSVAGAVVFSLKANVINRFSMKSFIVSNVNLYETGNSEIIINNPFDKDADFKIKIENIQILPEIRPKPKQKGRKSILKIDQQLMPSDDKSTFIPSFFIKQDRLWIRKGSSTKLYVQYLPITFETHKCFLVFLDPKVGEMQYEIVGKPKPPNPIDSFKMSIPIESFHSVDLNVPLKNTLFTAALMKLSDKIKEAKDFSYLPILEKMNANLETCFDIELIPNDFLTCQSPVLLGNKPSINQTRTTNADKNSLNNQVTKNNQNVSNQVPVNGKIVLIPIKKIPLKDLHVKICLKGKQKFDFRFYDLLLTVLPKTIKATIEIKTTARVPITQNIPVTNNNEFECIVKPTFVTMVNGHLFDIPLSQFQVKKKSFINFPLKFMSQWIEKAEAKLTLFNLNTNDNFEYLIKAESEEPLSENHEEIFTKAKKTTGVVLKIKNPIFDCKSFKVDCDIPDAEFNKKVSFEDSKSIEFKLNFTPIIGGSFMYSVTFSDENGRYFWHLLTVHVDSPEPSKILSVTTELRKPIVCKIEIENNFNKTVFYKTNIVGEFLTGDLTFEISPNTKDCYSLYYFPLKTENARKKIGFLSDEEGEIWFDIDCRCEESKIIKLPTFKAELGKSVSQFLSLRNPLKKKSIVVNCEQIENSNFNVSPKKFEIKPNDSVQVEIVYIPKDLGVNETEQVTFVSSDIGDWKYQLFGIGIPPTEFDLTNISTALGKSATKTFSFRNPFSQETNFTINVETSEGLKDLFELVLPKSKSTPIPPFGHIQILVKFTPLEICTYKARLLIRANESLQWVYPIIGITESIQGVSEFQIKTKCGVETETSNTYRLIGITSINPEEVFDHSFKINHKEAQNIEKWLKVKPIKNKISSSEEELSFAFNFLPHKPFKTVIEIVLTKPSGGRWKFKISLSALEPDYFDVLNIVSQLNVRKTIQFRLFNCDKKNSSPYVAYYTQESDSEFMVNPAKGILEPAINDGTIIEISYLPTQYGKAKTGILIVETDQNLWRFLIKGMFEKYVPPKNLKK